MTWHGEQRKALYQGAQWELRWNAFNRRIARRGRRYALDAFGARRVYKNKRKALAQGERFAPTFLVFVKSRRRVRGLSVSVV